MSVQDWRVDDLPDSFDRGCAAFAAVFQKWEQDRAGEDWPTPRYIGPPVSETPLIFAQGIIEPGVGENLIWAMELRHAQ